MSAPLPVDPELEVKVKKGITNKIYPSCYCDNDDLTS